MGNQCACFDASASKSPVESVTAQAPQHAKVCDTHDVVPNVTDIEKGSVSAMVSEPSTSASGEACMVLTFHIPDIRWTRWTSNRVSVDLHLADNRPLGLNLTKCTPVRVESVTQKSCAARGGVEEGWVLLKINDQDVSDKDFDCVVGCLKQEMRQLRAVGDLPEKSPRSRPNSPSSSQGKPRGGTPRHVEAWGPETQLTVQQDS